VGAQTAFEPEGGPPLGGKNSTIVGKRKKTNQNNDSSEARQERRNAFKRVPPLTSRLETKEKRTHRTQQSRSD